MRFNFYLRLVVLFALCATPLAAQDPKLKGKVLPADNPNIVPWFWGGIKVKVKNKANGTYDEREQRIALNQDWYHFASLGAVVDVLFDKGPCYVPDGLENISVERENPDMATVFLKKTRECKISERRKRRRWRASTQSGSKADAGVRENRDANDRASARDSTPPDKGGAASAAKIDSATSKSSSDSRDRASRERASRDRAPRDRADQGGLESSTRERREPIEGGISNNEPEDDSDLLPSPQLLKEELESEAAQARKGEFFDTFQSNFAIKWETYGSIGPLREVLSQFRNLPDNQDLFKQIGSIAPEAYYDVARAQFGISDEVNLDNIKSVIKEETLSPGVRGSAAVALLNLKSKLDEKTRQEMQEYFSQQNPSSEIFSTAVVASMSLRDKDDLTKFYDDILNSRDPRLVLTSVQALAVTQIIEGKGALPGADKTLVELAITDENPQFRGAAMYALGPFAHQRYRTAMTTLFLGARDSNPFVRTQAVRALGFSNLESDPRVRNLLRSVAMRDPLASVRREANYSLMGSR